MSKRSQISITKFSFSLLIILFSSFSSFAQEIGILSTEKPIYEIEKNYLENKTDNVALRKYIDARQKAGIYNNAELIEDYVSLLTIDDFNNYQTVLFILEAGPFTYGNAYKLAYSNPKIVDSIYKTEPLSRRIKLNISITNNTMSEAINTKDIYKAMSAADFTRRTYGNDSYNAEGVYMYEMLKYYRGVQDSSNYLRNAPNYYDQYLMKISVDSIKKIESINNTNFNNNTKKYLENSISNTYALHLNNAAWNFYETKTSNISYLTKAIEWSKRAIELKPFAIYYDTLAHLLYKLGKFDEAIKAQETALKSPYEPKGTSIEYLSGELKKIKERKL